jgi:hypothetical protein
VGLVARASDFERRADDCVAVFCARDVSRGRFSLGFEVLWLVLLMLLLICVCIVSDIFETILVQQTVYMFRIGRPIRFTTAN